MQLALDDAGTSPERVSALIAHATATPKGDTAEIAASGAVSVIAAAHAMAQGSFPNIAGTRDVDPAAGFDVVIKQPVAALPDDFDAAAAAGQVQRDIPGLLDVFEADNPGMHTSDTVDVDFVLSGEVDVELDDGVEVHLKAGDVLIQHGTRHAWRNKSDQPCVLVVAVTGARRA